MLRRASSDGTQGRTALDDRDAQRGRSSRLSSSHSQDIDGVFSGTMDYGAVESSSSLIRPGSDVLGTEVPGLQDSSHDHELFEMLAADKAHAGEAPQPRFLRWLPTWCGPLCLSLSIAGVLFLLVLSGLTSSGYEYIRLSGDYEKHSTNLLWAAVIYACTGALSVACICAQRPARPAVALHRR